MRNLMMLPRRGEPGKGWGCFQCHLPMDGASAVVRKERRMSEGFTRRYVQAECDCCGHKQRVAVDIPDDVAEDEEVKTQTPTTCRECDNHYFVYVQWGRVPEEAVSGQSES